ncbi:MAG: helix-hairpin-helix domain-containing protein [Ferruginibacter sp.]
MDNYKIADSFSLLAKLMDIHGENSFKSKSYASVSFAIENLTVQLTELPAEKIPGLKGIGASSAQKINELLETGQLKILEELTKKTPPGVLEMLNIKGIGPKKINTIWKEMEIESVGELLYACKENRLKLFKGFGEKTQQNVIDTIEFYFKNKESHLYVHVSLIAHQVESFIRKIFPKKRIALSGNFVRQDEVIDALEFVVEASEKEIENVMILTDGFTLKEKGEDSFIYATSAGVDVQLYWSENASFLIKLLRTSSTEVFYNALMDAVKGLDLHILANEEEYFKKAGLPFIPYCLREDPAVIELAKSGKLPSLVQHADIKGIIHSHSNWSDGSNTIEEMAMACIGMGLEYLVVSDHSRSAFYAQGLSVERIREQHIYIDELNEKMKPFRIFKSIESDILNDGSLDYSNEVLATFDLVIASVHSNIKMTEEKAMARLIKAIENPFTTILGHMTGRLLLSRPGYPVNHKKIIDACAENNVVIELNAHPNRLDMDWRHIQYALEKNVLISIDPDAHFIHGLEDIRYGVLVAQKAMLTKENNLSSFGLTDFEEFLKKTRLSRLKNV